MLFIYVCRLLNLMDNVEGRAQPVMTVSVVHAVTDQAHLLIIEMFSGESVCVWLVC